METLNKLFVMLQQQLGLAGTTIVPFESKKGHRIADKDSLRWSQAWFDQWADERERDAQVENYVRDEVGYINDIGFAPHALNANFGNLPAGSVPADLAPMMNSPHFLRAVAKKPRIGNWEL